MNKLGSINLKKGQGFNLTKKEPGLKKVWIGLGWEPVKEKLDLDASVFMLGENNKLVSESHFIFYNNKKFKFNNNIVLEHMGDNRNGDGDGDDEIIVMDLEKMDPAVSKVLIVVTIHEASKKGHTFGLMKEAYIRLMDCNDSNNPKQISYFDLDESAKDATEVEFGLLELKENSEWYFTALGEGQNLGLEELIGKYL